MDASQRCENMPAEELQSFEAYLERIKTQVAGQGIVQEITGLPSATMAQPLQSHPQRDSQFDIAGENINDLNNPAQPLLRYPPKDIQVCSSGGNLSSMKYGAGTMKGDSLFGEGADTYTVPYPPPLHQPLDHQHKQTGLQGDTRQPGRTAFMEGMVGGSGRYSVATSQPYGVTPGTSQLLKAAPHDPKAESIVEQLPRLNLTETKEVSSVGL